MKPYSTLGTPIAVIFLIAAFTAIVCSEDTSTYKINKIEPAFLDSPEISASNYRKQVKTKAKWLEVNLSLERVDRDEKSFSGDVVINYYILLNNAKHQTDGKPVLLTGSITLSDIPVGRQLHAAAFVSPQALLKLFGGKIPATLSQAITDLGITITANDQLASIDTLKGTVVGEKGWWDSGADEMTNVTGLVLQKEKTPFANLSWDYYLPAKISP